MDLCNINEIKALLARHGFHFSKAKGQNFLTQNWVPREIVARAGIDETCAALEVGPGIGPLTQELCRSAKKVIAIEVDRSLQPVLAETMAGNENLEIIFGDVLKTDIRALVAEEFAGLRPVACANLPYYITTPILAALLESRAFESITVMVQKEVAQRIAAPAGKGDYGAFSVFCQYYAVPELLFGKVVRVIDQPGLSLKTPFVQSTSTLPKTEMLYDLAASDVITSDKKSMVADSFVLWRIVDPLKFIQTLSGSVSGAEARLDQAVYNSLKTVISSMKQEDVISGRDGELAARITEHVNDTTEFRDYGIEVLAIETKRIDLPDENKAAVYERMISERGNIAASYEAQGNAEAKRIRNEADKTVDITISEANSQSEKLKAAGEAEYMRILSEAYDTPEEADFYEFMRALDMAQKALVGGNKTLVVSSDSPIAKIFSGQWGQAE